jgi:hypothetical protein
MAQPIDAGRSIKQGNQPEVAKKRPVKRTYITPTILEYGSIAKLTQGASGPLGDGSLMRTVCL